MVRRWIFLVVALLVLNTSLSFANIWPTLGIRWTPQLSVEVALGVLALAAAAQWLGGLSRRGIRVLAVVWVVLVILRYADVTTRSLYGRDINLYWDLQFVPDVSAMFAVVAHPWLVLAVLIGAVLVPLLVYFPVRWALARVNEAVRVPRARVALAGTASALLLVGTPSALTPSDSPTFAAPVTAAIARQVTLFAEEVSGAGLRALPAAPDMRSNLARVKGADVFLVFAESYGAVSWDRPEFATALAPSRESLDAAIRETGRGVASAFVESTTFGGESWLAHISLISGTSVRDQNTNVRLMAQDRDTLVKAFGRNGYRTVAIMPGLQREWPQGAFYGFEEIYGTDRLAYQGPPFGWWGINDQFALARMDALEIAAPDRRPAFVVFPTISSHAPFTPAPPYQPDWPRMLTPTPYDSAELDRAWSDVPDWTNLSPSYVQAITYMHQTLGGYLRLRGDRDFVVIVVGDHQPPALVSGEGASWDVPVHVIASRPAVLEALRRNGFSDGLTPRHPGVARMDTLLPILLDAFGDRAVAPATAD